MEISASVESSSKGKEEDETTTTIVASSSSSSSNAFLYAEDGTPVMMITPTGTQYMLQKHKNRKTQTAEDDDEVMIEEEPVRIRPDRLRRRRRRARHEEEEPEEEDDDDVVRFSSAPELVPSDPWCTATTIGSMLGVVIFCVALTTLSFPTAWLGSGGDQRICSCNGVSAFGYWLSQAAMIPLYRLHTNDTYKKSNPRRIEPVTSKRDILNGVHSAVETELTAQLVMLHQNHTAFATADAVGVGGGAASATAIDALSVVGILCSHHIDWPSTIVAGQLMPRLCALRRFKGHSMLIMYNLELKGYSNMSEIRMEKTVMCPNPAIRQRRIAVDIGFTTSGEDPTDMRVLIDDKHEAFEIQQAWEEMKGIYACAST